MTDLLYQTDSYLREFDATVTEVTAEGVVLDRSVFCPVVVPIWRMQR